MKTTRAVTPAECRWLDKEIPAGTEVHQFYGATYGCIGSGIAVSYQPNEGPFFELPRDALTLTGNGDRA